MKNIFKTNFFKGFTLVEILIVVVIVGILAAIAIPTYYKYVEKGYASDAKVQIQNIAKSSDLYYGERGEYPTAWEDIYAEGLMDLLPPSVSVRWEFAINLSDQNGVGVGTIEARSLEGMSGGAGKTVSWNKETGVYTGYGQKE